MSIGPDFVGIGVQRGGTSWLYQCFKEHPEIFMPQKEVHFFNNQYDKGIDWYTGLFDTGESKTIKGEITPDYLNNKQAIERLHAHCPDAKLIVILREPFERAHSAVGLLQAHGQYKDDSFDTIISQNQWIIQQSLYAAQLEHLFTLFSKDQVKIFLFEDVSNKPLVLLQQVFTFIGVDPNFQPPAFKDKYNVSGKSKLEGLVNLERIQSSLRKNAAGRAVLKLKKLQVVKDLKSKLIDSSESENVKANKCSPELKNTINEDIKKVEALIGVDLHHWY